MLRKLLQKLTGKPEPKGKEPRFLLGDGFYYEFDEVSNGYGGYRMINVYLLKIDDPRFRRCIVDSSGVIRNFPGVVKSGWEKELEFPLDHKVRFRFSISKFLDGEARVSWTLQPDGRYFEDDDGFGAEDCEEITLYSWLDQNGRFTEAFRVWEDESADSTDG